MRTSVLVRIIYLVNIVSRHYVFLSSLQYDNNDKQRNDIVDSETIFPLPRKSKGLMFIYIYVYMYVQGVVTSLYRLYTFIFL